MAKLFRCVVLVAAVLGGFGCSKSELGAVLVFPDAFTANLDEDATGQPKVITKGLTITAVEPFAFKEGVSGDAERVLVRCGEIGVFPPTSIYDRTDNTIEELPSADPNRIFEPYPFGEQWNYDIPEPRSGKDVNPWGAMLVHLEVRGEARKYNSDEGRFAGDKAQDETLLEGCFCMRLEDADAPDEPLNDEVLDNCAPVSTFDAGPREVLLEPVMPPVFSLLERGVTAVAAVAGQPLRLDPGVEVDTIECGQVSSTQNCFACASPSCTELSNKSNVPVRVEVVGDIDPSQVYVAPQNRIVLTDGNGVVVPQIEVESCNADFQVSLSLVGRPTEFVTFDVNCVDDVNLPLADSVQVSEPSGRFEVIPQSVSALPGTRLSGGSVAPTRLALLSELSPEDEEQAIEARLELYEARGGSLVVSSTIGFVGEIPRGVFGFYYDLSDRSAPSRPVLAVATSTVIQRSPQEEEFEDLRLRFYDASDASGALVEIGTLEGGCTTCGCSQPDLCEVCAAEERGELYTDEPCTTEAECVGCDGGKDCACEMSAGASGGFCRRILTCQTDGDCNPRSLDQSGTCEDGSCFCAPDGVCRVKPCFASIKQPTVIRMAAEDLNGDGFADVAIANDQDFVMTTFYSQPHRHDISGGTVQLPPLGETCKCASMGKLLQTFELVQLGGESDTRDSRAVDVIMGDPTGAFLRYAEGPTLDGPPCDPGSSAARINEVCGTGRDCVPVCTGSFSGEGRCATPCTMGDDTACQNPLQPVCSAVVTSPGDENSVRNVCTGPVFGCRQPNSVWKLTGVSDITSIQLRPGSPFQDAVAVAQGSPVPGNADQGRVRLLYGSNLDLTEFESMPKELKKQALLDLIPAQIPNEDGMPSPPQGARSTVVGDFNGDGLSDFAVLFGGSEEVRIWLGGGVDAPAELTWDLDDPSALRSIQLKEGNDRECFPLSDFVAADLDGDDRSEVIVVCNTVAELRTPSRIRWFRPN